MNRKKINIVIFHLFFVFLILNISISQEKQWLVTTLIEPSAGYIKFDNLGFEKFYLFDNYGNKIFEDTSSFLNGGNYCELLPNGFWSIYKDGRYHIYNQNMQFVHTINFSADNHDMTILPNGHYLIINVLEMSIDMSSIVDGGNENATVMGAILYEVDNNGIIYWSWNSFENFNILDVTSEVDLTHPVIPFTHANSVTYDSLGNIFLSSRNLDEITKINRQTGEIIWRWGGSACQNNEFTFINDTKNGFTGFSHQHSINILPNGNILLYDNGNLKNDQTSRAVEYKLNEENKTVTKVWEYYDSPSRHYSAKGSVQRLENGNTLINWGEDKITEVTKENKIAFEMRSKDYFPVYRAFRYVTRQDAVGLEIEVPSTYVFNNEKYSTDITVVVKNLSGRSYAMVEKHYYSPATAFYKDESFSSILPYRWVFGKNGIKNISGDIKIKLDNLNFSGDKNKLTIYGRTSENAGSFEELNTSYFVDNNELVASFTNFGEFIIGSNLLSQTILSSPSNGEMIPMNDGFLQWEKTKGAISYRLQISNSSDFSKMVTDTIIGTNFYKYKDLGNKKTYFWRVVGMNQKDTSDWSVPFYFITELGPPVLFEPEDQSEGFDTIITFRWGSVSDSCKYWLQISDSEDFVNLVFENKNIDIVDFNAIVPEFYTFYFWRVCSIESQDTSSWSETRKFMTIMAKPKVINFEDKSINLPVIGVIEWNSIKGATGFKIQISENDDFSSLIINESSVSDTSYQYSNLKNFQIYYLRLQAFNGKDSSKWSNSIEFTTLMKKANLIEPADGSDEVERLTLFIWDSITDAINYKLQVSFDVNFEQMENEQNEIYETKFSNWEFPKNKQIFWRVKGYKDFYESEWSDVWSFITESGMFLSVPQLISPVNGSTDNDKNGILQWESVDEALYYTLYLSKSETFEGLIINDSNIIDNRYDYLDLEYDSTYYWKVKAYNHDKFSKWSEVFAFTTKNGSVVGDNETNNILSINPSPADDLLFIRFNNQLTGNFYLKVFDEIGITKINTNIFVKFDESEIEVDLSEFSSGIYFLVITNGTSKFISKFIVIRK